MARSSVTLKPVEQFLVEAFGGDDGGEVALAVYLPNGDGPARFGDDGAQGGDVIFHDAVVDHGIGPARGQQHPGIGITPGAHHAITGQEGFAHGRGGPFEP